MVSFHINACFFSKIGNDHVSQNRDQPNGYLKKTRYPKKRFFYY